MSLHIDPEPTPEERQAVEAALQRLLAGSQLPPAYLSAWRQAGIREAVEDQAAVARPRNSFGATRA